MFYGWWIVGGVFVAQLFMQGFFTYGFPLLVVPVQAEFEAARADVVLAVSAGGIVGLFIAPVVGTLVDKWSVRRLMILGVLALSAALFGMSISASVIQFVVTFALLTSAANMLLGPITCSAVVSRWFVASRGRALGIAAIGTSIGGMLVPMLMQHWIDTSSWRGCLESLSITVLVVVLPLVFFAIRDDPADRGLEAEGAVHGGGDAGSFVERDWSNRDILSSVPFWLISGCLGLLFFVYTSVMTNLGAYASGIGVGGEQTATAISVLALCGMLGKLVFGYAADRISLRLGLWITLGLAAAGVLVLALELGHSALLASAVLLGLATGGMLPVWGAMIAAIFGVTSYGRVMGLMTPVIGVIVAPGPIIAGAMADASGSYAVVLYLFAGVLGFASSLLLPLKMPARSTLEASGA